MEQNKKTIKVTETNINSLGTKYHKFYIVGCSRPITKKVAKEGLKLKARIIAIEKTWGGNK